MTTGDKMGRSTSSTSCRWQVSVFAAILLVGLSSGLPAGKEQKPSRPDASLLNGAVGELEDALSRLRQYAQGLKSGVGHGNHGQGSDDNDDPLAESIERESRDEDYRQEPELVPNLDRFQKNVDENKEARGKTQNSAARSTNRDETNQISLQDLINFLREHKNKKNEDQTGAGDVNRLIELEGSKTTVKSTLAANGVSHMKDMTIDELVAFLKEKQREKDRSDDRLPGKSSEPHSAVDVGRKSASADSSDMSLNEAIDYLAGLKKKLNNKSE